MRPRAPARLWTWRVVMLEVARLAAMLLATVLLQSTVAPHIRILGARPDLPLLAVICVGLLRGPEIGAIYGFLSGALAAVAMFGPPGVDSLVLVIIGYVAGRYGETVDTSSAWAPLSAACGGTLVAKVISASAQYLLDRTVPVGFFIGRAVLPALVLNTLLIAPAYLAARFWLREGGERARPA